MVTETLIKPLDLSLKEKSIQSVSIVGKAMTCSECPWDTEEVWGVNNVASQPEFTGGLCDIKIKNVGSGYTKASITITGGGSGGSMIPGIVNGQIGNVNLAARGIGYTNPTAILEGDGTGAEVEVTAYPIRKFTKLFAFDLLPKEYTDGMKTFAPVCSWQDYADIKYPKDDLIAEFKTKYFTNTVAYMVALCAYLKVPLIKLYGVDVSFGAAYAQENRGVEYWIGRAEERGVKVFVAPSSHLLRTVSGAMYGDRDHCNVMMYLHERINLINMLPREGHYSDALISQNAWWVLFPKEDEAKANGVQVQKMPDGTMAFQCNREFSSDLHMPPETWEYLRNLLRDMEKRGKLPFAAIPIYEKLILAKPDGGN